MRLKRMNWVQASLGHRGVEGKIPLVYGTKMKQIACTSWNSLPFLSRLSMLLICQVLSNPPLEGKETSGELPDFEAKAVFPFCSTSPIFPALFSLSTASECGHLTLA